MHMHVQKKRIKNTKKMYFSTQIFPHEGFDIFSEFLFHLIQIIFWKKAFPPKTLFVYDEKILLLFFRICHSLSLRQHEKYSTQ